MIKKLSFLFIFFITANQLYAQILPKEGVVLNYRLIGFKFPAEKNANKCKLEIAKGNYNTEDSFRKNIIKTIPCEKNKIIGEVPFFGESYTWRVVYANKTKIKSELHHFSTGIIPEVDTSKVRLRIIQPAEKYKDAYVFLDNNKAMYDMKGNPVWFLPDKISKGMYPTDLKLSPQGTITFLLINAYEINYNCDILWKAPDNGVVSGDTEEHYHHEFTRLINGHYMTLGNEYVIWNRKLLSSKDSDRINMLDDKTKREANSNISAFGTIIEYDENGKVVWSWKSSGYFKKYGHSYYNTATNPTEDIIDVHANGFYFDEKSKYIYVSFKNINQIIKIKYPEGIVVNTFGEFSNSGVKGETDIVFCGQHSVRKSGNGYLYLFNNNSCNERVLPNIIVMQEPSSGKNDLKKTWEYTCTIEGRYPKKSPKGGNVLELPDNSFFVSMGGPYSKIFIVSMDKKILWKALPERRNVAEKKWDVITQ